MRTLRVLPEEDRTDTLLFVFPDEADIDELFEACAPDEVLSDPGVALLDAALLEAAALFCFAHADAADLAERLFTPMDSQTFAVFAAGLPCVTGDDLFELWFQRCLAREP